MSYLNSDHPAITKYLLKCINKLVIASNNAIVLMSPEKVVLYGRLFSCDRVYNEFINEIYEKNPMIKKDLFERSQAEEKTPFIGATTIAIEKALFKL